MHALNAAPIRLLKIDKVSKEEYLALPNRQKQDYEFDEENNCYKVPDYIWAGKWRKHGPYYYDPMHPQYIKVAIGGSDIAVGYDGSQLQKDKLINLYPGQHGSNFKSAAELCYEKAGNEFGFKDPSSDVLYTGHLEEPAIRARFKLEYQKDHPMDVIDVINDTYMYQCGARDGNGNLLHPYVLCNLDGRVIINGEEGIFEAKTCNPGSEDIALWKKRIVPLKYYLQACYYMICMNVDYAYIACKWGISESEFVYIRIDRNRNLDEGILQIARELADCIEMNRLPSFEGQSIELINKFYRKLMGPIVPDAKPVLLTEKETEAAQELTVLLVEEEQIKQKLENIQKRKQELLCSSIFPKAEDSSKAFVPMSDGYYCEISYKNPSGRFSVDVEKLKTERPELVKQYTCECCGHFDESLFRKEYKDIAKKYAKKELTESKRNYCKVKYVHEAEVKAQV